MPSDLFDRYDGEGGQYRLQFDLAIAAEIGDRLLEQTENAKGKRNAKKAVAERNRNRSNRMTGAELGEALKDTFGDIE